MAANSIASLAVKLTANAEDFDKELGRAEQRLTGFANRLASPLNLARGVGGSVTDLLVNPFNSLLTDVTRFGVLLPGIGLGMAAIAHPVVAAEAAMERLVHLGKDAEDIGVSTQFM